MCWPVAELSQLPSFILALAVYQRLDGQRDMHYSVEFSTILLMLNSKTRFDLDELWNFTISIC